MSVDNVVGVVVVALLAGYLLCALLFPERFSR